VPPPPSTRPSRRAEFLSTVRGQWWGHLLIAAALTVVLGGIADDGRELLMVFAAMALISFCIATATTAVYVFRWGTVLLEGSPIRRALAHGLSIAVGVGVGTEVALAILRLSARLGLEVTIDRVGIWQVGAVITLLTMMGSITIDRLRERVRAVELREQAAQQALLQAQLDSLRARIDPHFLFNALNTVASLVEEDPEAAVEAVERLSELLRHSLQEARHDRVVLRRELEAVRGYLALEQLRFGERLRSRVEVAPELLAAAVPPFVLQPLVENAIKHGIAPRRDGGRVDVTIRREGDHLHVRVEDDGPGHSAASGTQVGHQDLRRRLALLYGERARFTAGPGPEGGYRVDLTLPHEAPRSRPEAAS